MKALFLAAASHDLRQPLHAIGMFVGVLRRRSRDPVIIEVADSIAISVASMERMCLSLLDVARLEGGAINIQRRRVKLQNLFDSLEAEFAPSAAFKRLSLQIQSTSHSVTADPGLLETVLRNLLSNAIKFTDRGRVGMATDRRGNIVDVVVSDTGIGIRPRDQSVIFEQFERRSRYAREGLGLGLWIVRRMADLLNITVTLESRPGEGSRFTVSLPLACPEAQVPSS
jgi:signal transduction histidine kinase